MSAIGPSTNATCLSGFSWANDAAGNSPCFVAAAVVGACLNADYNVPPLIPGNHYANAQPVNGCSCACTACQGFNESILTWAGYNTNCTGSLISNTTYYPSDVVTLDNTSYLSMRLQILSHGRMLFSTLIRRRISLNKITPMFTVHPLHRPHRLNIKVMLALLEVVWQEV
ncbi:hypothetical protein BDP27DRAFT_280610 [Rhodocollybia butyracea]|uniref:Uncharacterized protein n=1 Tax=Rhodocollybia butyracea TaxID=206335 RepID=A0A9P5Q3I9_9AGAR|nr:hypothetical protein BDP27DRAFT_280610 [Rhodocollybia butyracea]